VFPDLALSTIQTNKKITGNMAAGRTPFWDVNHQIETLELTNNPRITNARPATAAPMSHEFKSAAAEKNVAITGIKKKAIVYSVFTAVSWIIL
jgi:hypothetical protein